MERSDELRDIIHTSNPCMVLGWPPWGWGTDVLDFGVY